MTFFQFIKTAFAYARYMPRFTEAADHEDAWTKEDTRAYEQFMRSPTGQKLALKRENFAYKCALNATQASHSNLDHRCGWASGVRAQTLHEIQLYNLSPASAHDAPEEQTGAAELLEIYAP